MSTPSSVFCGQPRQGAARGEGWGAASDEELFDYMDGSGSNGDENFEKGLKAPYGGVWFVDEKYTVPLVDKNF